MTEITYINERIFKNIKKSQQAPDFKIFKSHTFIPAERLFCHDF